MASDMTIEITRELLTSKIKPATIVKISGRFLYLTMQDLQNKEIIKSLISLMTYPDENVYIYFTPNNTPIDIDLKFTNKHLYSLDTWHSHHGTTFCLSLDSNNSWRISYDCDCKLHSERWPTQFIELQTKLITALLTA